MKDVLIGVAAALVVIRGLTWPLRQVRLERVPDLCYAFTDDYGSFCGRALPCPEHGGGA